MTEQNKPQHTADGSLEDKASQNAEGDNNVFIQNVLNELSPPPNAGLVAGPIADTLIEEAVDAFCVPGEYGQAARILAHHRLVLLCGPSSGRSLAAVRLLIDRNRTDLNRLDSGRPANDLSLLKEKSPRAAYIWDDVQADIWSGGLDTHLLKRLEHVLVELDTYLVVTFADDDLDLSQAQPYLAQLTAPPAEDIVRAHLKARKKPPDLVSQLDPGTELPEHTAPRHAAEIARLLCEVEAGVYTLPDVKETLRSHGDANVADWFAANESIAVRALAICVALLEGCAYGKIASAARRLEEALSNPKNDELWPYLAPDLFNENRASLMRRIRARFEPPMAGAKVDPERVRFSRPGWGRRLLAYTWKEHDRLRPVLHDWLSGLDTEIPALSADHDDAMARLGSMLARAAEPVTPTFGWFYPWVDGTNNQRSMVAHTMSGLCENPSYVLTVKSFVHSWSMSWTREHLRLTAALTCRNRFGRDHPEFALNQLRRLTKNCGRDLKREVARSLESLLGEPSNRGLVLCTLPFWILHGGAVQKELALNCAFSALSLGSRLPLLFSDRETVAVRLLFTALLEDATFRPRVMSGLTGWSIYVQTHTESKPHVVAVLRMLLNADNKHLVRRSAYFLRRAFAADRDFTAPLAALTAQVLKEISDDR